MIYLNSNEINHSPNRLTVEYRKRLLTYWLKLSNCFFAVEIRQPTFDYRPIFISAKKPITLMDVHYIKHTYFVKRV